MGVAIHSKESFDEAAAIRLLEDTLESRGTIKTFFKENDRTPNHDGFFELIDHSSAPQKQFVVQIKKTKKLKKNVKGANKGKYVYSMETNFLEYIKQKVTESPAIYFVVDIEEKRIFWLYLSDEALMNLNFEGKSKISYAFTEENILSEISSFTMSLHQIATERNKLFLNKTQEEIAEMQDAVDYLNHHLDYELKAIKESVFPQLWRIGIKRSDNPGITISVGQSGNAVACQSAVALYPQIKGKNDSGLHEYSMEDENIFNHLSFGRQVNLIDYSKESLNKILVMFFEKGIPAKYLPDIVLFEIINTFIRKSNVFFESIASHELSIEEVRKRYILILGYMQYLLGDSPMNDEEKNLTLLANNRINRGDIFFFDIVSQRRFVPFFSSYCSNFEEAPPIINPHLYLYITRDYLVYFDVLKELEHRNVQKIPFIWDYDWFSICTMPRDSKAEAIERITSTWISQLASLYDETYDKLFTCNTFKVRYKYYFRAEIAPDAVPFGYFGYLYKKYTDSKLSFSYDPDIRRDSIVAEHKETGLRSMSCGADLDSMFKDYMPFYYGLSCLLYNGICDALGFNRKKIKIGYKGMSNEIAFF